MKSFSNMTAILLSAAIIGLFSGCKTEKEAPRGFDKGNLPDKVEFKTPGFAKYISPRAFIDSVSAGVVKRVFFIEDLPTDTPEYIVPVPGMVHMFLGDYYTAANHMSNDEPIYLICLYGDDSKRAAEYLIKDGFKTYHLDGGSFRLYNEMRKNNWRFNTRLP